MNIIVAAMHPLVVSTNILSRIFPKLTRTASGRVRIFLSTFTDSQQGQPGVLRWAEKILSMVGSVAISPNDCQLGSKNPAGLNKRLEATLGMWVYEKGRFMLICVGGGW